MCVIFFFFKQKSAYEMRISDWSSDVCSSDLEWGEETAPVLAWWRPSEILGPDGQPVMVQCAEGEEGTEQRPTGDTYVVRDAGHIFGVRIDQLQSLMLVAPNRERKHHAARPPAPAAHPAAPRHRRHTPPPPPPQPRKP